MSLSTPPRNGKEFEEQISLLLERVLPHCYLPGVPIFRADAAMSPDSMANEIDFICHLRNGQKHTLLIIECKSCRVTGKGDGRGNFAPPTPSSPWLAHYPRDQKEKSIKDQLRAQRQALLTNLEPLDGEVRVHAVVVASQPEGLNVNPGYITTQELPSFELSLVRSDRFEQYLSALLEGATPLRVQQSEILRRIRQGQPLPALGHPEIYNAIEYTRRCRAFIDSEIFRHLKFTTDRWAINGSAGMGKSVLLIYATMVFITDRFIDCLRDGSRFLQSFTEDASKISLAPLEKRRVWVISHSEKQRDMLERMFDRFTELYGEVDSYNEYRRVKPEFHVFSEVSNIDCNILLVDEAHDLGPQGEKRVREWHESNPGNYLVIACDRHQKLRLAQDETRMIQGINFSRCTKKLSRNYRNPFPAYAGSIGLLFRWFAASGPKTLPKPKELRDEFGFGEAALERPGVWLLRSRNDAHPANNWSHTLSTFPSAESAYQQLSEFPLCKEHVLWVRFTAEESDFNYESLQHWSYHSVYGADASDLLDKYVKGQEFPVVVIEGVPELFAWSVASRQHPQDAAQARIKMWQARRQLYLAASRANVFLYFILPANTPADVGEEFRAMFTQLAHQPDQDSPSGTDWNIRISETTEVESFESYVDAIEDDLLTPIAPAVVVQAESVIESPAAMTAAAANTVDEAISPQSASAPPPSGSIALVNEPLTQATPPAADPISLSSVTTIAEAAKAFGVDIDHLTTKLAARGFKQLAPSSPVRAEYVIRLMKAKDLPDSANAKTPIAPALAESKSPPHEHIAPSAPQAAPLPQPVIQTGATPKSFSNLDFLGGTNTLDAVARALGRDIFTVVAQMAAAGFPSLHAKSKVMVPFVENILRNAAPAKRAAVNSSNPSAHSATASALQTQLVTPQAKSSAAKSLAPSDQPQSSQFSSMKLRELAARLLLPVRMVNSFLETEGVFILNENEYVRAVDVEHLVLKLCGNAGFRGFQQVAKSSIRLNALANYLGQRPSVLARDLKLDQLALASHTCVPYKTIVQLCFYYGKRLPIPVTKKRSK